MNTRHNVGDLVYFRYAPHTHYVVERIDDAGRHYLTSGLKRPQDWTCGANLKLVYCANCKQSRSAHADNGKCIYGPGNWEAP